METSNINLDNGDYPQYSLDRHDMETENIKNIKNMTNIELTNEKYIEMANENYPQHSLA